MKNLAYAIRPLVLDMLSTLFFAGVFALTNNVILSTAVGMVTGVAQIAWLLMRRRKVAGLQYASVGLVIVMGSAAIITHDPRFVMIKPTIIYTVVAASMLQPGWMLRYMPPASLEYLPRSLIVAGGYAWAGLMALTAGLNIYFAFFTSPVLWAAFLAVFPLASKFAAFAIHYASFRLVALRNAKAGRSFSPETGAPVVPAMAEAAAA